MAAVTVSLYGGLGNQLFQYAMGRALALQGGLPLELDLYGFDFDRRYRRRLELDHFRIPAGLRTVRRPALFHLGRALRRLAAARPEVAALAPPWLLVESARSAEGHGLAGAARRGAYLAGYWQDERYFLAIRPVLREDLRLAGPLTPANQRVAEELAAGGEPVAVHVRRLHGGGAGDPRAQLGLDYYRRAARLVAGRAARPRFVVFSDEPAWARAHLDLGGAEATFLAAGRGPDHQDLHLMSLCRHHVLANSSFSWWGAWLAAGEGQVVVAPAGMPYTPGIPERWLRLA